MSYTPRLREKYSTEIISELTEKFGYKSVMQVPKLQKIVISQGIGDAVGDKKLIDKITSISEHGEGCECITCTKQKDYE